MNILSYSYELHIDFFPDFIQVPIFWTYFTTNSTHCKISRKLGQRVLGSMVGDNGRRDRKKRRPMDKNTEKSRTL